MQFKDHDIQLIFGDLNFRIDLDEAKCKEMIKNGNLTTLALYDQLLKAKTVNPNLYELDEGVLNFDPTYKYDIGKNEYDTSNKKRVPSW